MPEPQLRQIVSYDDCKACGQCCKFDDYYRTKFSPALSPEKKDELISSKRIGEDQVVRKKDAHRLRFDRKKNGEYHCSCLGKGMECTLQKAKPFDCALYPFVLMRAKEGKVLMMVDETCPKIAKIKDSDEFLAHAQYLRKEFCTQGMGEFLSRNPQVVEPAQKGLKELFAVGGK
ncbi:MAG TPA: hypothetical protein VJB12_03430 [Candidatus Nanoarchaeia archaeon]|nr:hypothetical protein [Candidatus Nanoarchaeia archaeon]